MSNRNPRWRAVNRTTDIADVIDRYRRLRSLDAALNRSGPDPSDEMLEARHSYMAGVQRLLSDMVRHIPAPEGDRRQAMEHLDRTAEPDTGHWNKQPVAALREYWNSTRQDLDHDIAAIAGVPLLLGMVAARDDYIAGIERHVAALQAELAESTSPYYGPGEHLAQAIAASAMLAGRTATGESGSDAADYVVLRPDSTAIYGCAVPDYGLLDLIGAHIPDMSTQGTGQLRVWFADNFAAPGLERNHLADEVFTRLGLPGMASWCGPVAVTMEEDSTGWIAPLSPEVRAVVDEFAAAPDAVATPVHKNQPAHAYTGSAHIGDTAAAGPGNAEADTGADL